jgi:1,4-alpha-glucan branching enzyme
MYNVRNSKKTILFEVRPAGHASDVRVAGSFTDWQTVPMKKQKDGKYVCEIPVPAGAFEYKYVVDGKWITDPDYSRWSVSPLGTINSMGEAPQ